jgi:hypothetical protein
MSDAFEEKIISLASRANVLHSVYRTSRVIQRESAFVIHTVDDTKMSFVLNDKPHAEDMLAYVREIITKQLEAIEALARELLDGKFGEEDAKDVD